MSTIQAILGEPYLPRSLCTTSQDYFTPTLLNSSLTTLLDTLSLMFINKGGEAVDADSLTSILLAVIEASKSSFHSAAKRVMEELDDVVTGI